MRERLQHPQLVGELGLLELDADALAQGLRRSLSQVGPQHLHRPGVGGVQALEDLDGRGLAGAVGAEQTEALAGAHLEVDPIDGDQGPVALDETAAAESGRHEAES